jgi:uncharacterized oligopeptide transporter (OPT) family protein
MSLREGLTGGFESSSSTGSNAYFPPYVTARALILGTLSAVINSFINMVFNFRSGAGLSTFWITVVAFAVFKGLDKHVPLGHFLHRRDFNPQEHGFVVLMASAAKFRQSLGLSSGLAVLELDYGKTFGFGQLLVWTAAAGFFGLFLGMLYARVLVVDTDLPWPGAQSMADTIFAFHGEIEEIKSNYEKSNSSKVGRPSKGSAGRNHNLAYKTSLQAMPSIHIVNNSQESSVALQDQTYQTAEPAPGRDAVAGSDDDSSSGSESHDSATTGRQSEAAKALWLFSKFAFVAALSYLLDQV